jgi:hypothetical protein
MNASLYTINVSNEVNIYADLMDRKKVTNYLARMFGARVQNNKSQAFASK